MSLAGSLPHAVNLQLCHESKNVWCQKHTSHVVNPQLCVTARCCESPAVVFEADICSKSQAMCVWLTKHVVKLCGVGLTYAATPQLCGVGLTYAATPQLCGVGLTYAATPQLCSVGLTYAVNPQCE